MINSSDLNYMSGCSRASTRSNFLRTDPQKIGLIVSPANGKRQLRPLQIGGQSPGASVQDLAQRQVWLPAGMGDAQTLRGVHLISIRTPFAVSPAESSWPVNDSKPTKF